LRTTFSFFGMKDGMIFCLEAFDTFPAQRKPSLH
jgi:hypothetical protein